MSTITEQATDSRIRLVGTRGLLKQFPRGVIRLALAVAASAAQNGKSNRIDTRERKLISS